MWLTLISFENYLISIEKCKDALKNDMSMRKGKRIMFDLEKFKYDVLKI